MRAVPPKQVSNRNYIDNKLQFKRDSERKEDGDKSAEIEENKKNDQAAYKKLITKQQVMEKLMKKL